MNETRRPGLRCSLVCSGDVPYCDEVTGFGVCDVVNLVGRYKNRTHGLTAVLSIRDYP